MLRLIAIGMMLTHITVLIPLIRTGLRSGMTNDRVPRFQHYWLPDMTLPIRNSPNSQDIWVPDHNIRERVEGLCIEDIATLRFSGQELIGSETGFIYVEDRDLIKRFVNALQHAVIRKSDTTSTNSSNSFPPPLERNFDRSGCLTLLLKKDIKVGIKDPRTPPLGNLEINKRLEFGFIPSHPARCYGPKFYEALRALSSFQAKRIREKAILAEQRRASVGFQSTLLAENPVEAPATPLTNNATKSLLAALQKADEKAFVCFRERTGIFHSKPAVVDIDMPGETKVRLYLILAPLRSGYNNPDWLKTLWHLLEEQENLAGTLPPHRSPPSTKQL